MCRPVSSHCFHHNLKHSIDQANLVDESRIKCREIADQNVSFLPDYVLWVFSFRPHPGGPAAPVLPGSHSSDYQGEGPPASGRASR